MSRTQTIEDKKLFEAESFLSNNTKSFDERIRIIECAAAEHGGADIVEYWSNYSQLDHNIEGFVKYGSELNKIVERIDISYPLVIAALAREPLSIDEQKKDGVFYTDYRLASAMGEACASALREDSSVADLAAGTGILLAAVALEYKKKHHDKFEQWIKTSLFAFDLSHNALRGAAAAILSMTCHVSAVISMQNNWKVCDSLFDIDNDTRKFDVVIGNPPWGKIKMSRHTFLKRNGEDRVYGSDYTRFDYDHYASEQELTKEYSRKVKQTYNRVGDSESDMYMPFLQKAVTVASENGQIIYLVPAGIIRSKGTYDLREFLFENASELSISLFDNKPRYFAIDTRFKFVLLNCKKKSTAERLHSFEFRICDAKSTQTEFVAFSIDELRSQRPDLTVPEVRNSVEKKLFDKLYDNGRKWGETDDEWKAVICREVDMTNDRDKFSSAQSPDGIPVIEGRMVQQHRFGAKAYVSGSGRSATWIPCTSGYRSQFAISPSDLSKDILMRSQTVRVGYCDIAGQTNERAMMSTIIPAGVVCGNKVPTIVFPNDPSGDLKYLWVGITNSFVFDWIIRRIISTTINYFLLLSVPIPQIELSSKTAQRIIDATKRLSEMNGEYYSSTEMQLLRAEIDAMVACAYGLSYDDICVILDDFPLVDRKQPSLNHGTSVTKDLVLAAMKKDDESLHRVAEKYWEIGATAYIPTEMTLLTEGGK